MKRVILSLILLSNLFIITACNNSNNITFKEDLKHQLNSNYTYKFVGESEHFYFETGKVYYNDNERELLISNFHVKGDISKNSKFSLNLYFNDDLLYGNVSELNLLSRQDFENTVISEHGYLGEKNESGNITGESDSFFETPKEKFKTNIKLEVKYCIKDKCETETLKLKYIE